ncbi:MAG: response regulator [Candidatus Thiodiazotropha sp.]|jgi:PAS domain S-box-containing protein
MNPSQYKKILVVDNNASNLQLLMDLLTEKGYTVYPAINGKLAMEFVKSRLPDLILLDIKMPGLDGYEVCQQLKANDSTRPIPVIFLSALEDENDKVKGFQAGGVDYITKPFQSEELLARVGIHLRLRALTEGLEQEVSARTLKLRIANKRLGEEVTRRQELEEALRESRQRLGNIVFNSPGAIYRCANDELWTMEFISAAITTITGYSSEDFLHNQVRSFASIIHPQDRKRVISTVTTALASKGRFEIDFRLVTADGSLCWVYNQGLGVFTPDGKLLCQDGIIVDITTQRKAEEMLKLSAERMATLLQLYQMSDTSQDELMRFTYEAAIRLTRSKLGYLGLMNEDETTLNIQCWSSGAMAECNVQGMPQIFSLEGSGLWDEAIRQRRPIITNDYVAPNPLKKGVPEGDVKLIRHMNLPVIVDDKIVLVAGVGNKEEDYSEADVQQLRLLMEGMWRLIESMRTR